MRQRGRPAVEGEAVDGRPGPYERAKLLGSKIRELRSAQGLSLAKVADACGISTSLLSQVERGIVTPSLATLHGLGQFFGVPVFAFFLDDSEPREFVVRKGERKMIKFPAAKVVYELITPDTKRQLEIIEMVLDQGQETLEAGLPHPGEECSVVLQGVVTIFLGDHVYDLAEGDSVYFDSTIPHRYKNRTKRVARLLSVITPPSF